MSNATEIFEQVKAWCGEHQKATAVIIAVAVGLLLGLAVK